jgi:hypothetical protein
MDKAKIIAIGIVVIIVVIAAIKIIKLSKQQAELKKQISELQK